MAATSLICLCALTAEGARQWAQHTAAQRLEETLTRRGWRGQWGSLQLGYDLTLTVDALEAEHNGGARLGWERLSAALHLQDLIQGRRHPRAVTLQAPSFTATPDALSSLRDASQSSHHLPPAPSSAQQSDARQSDATQTSASALPWPLKAHLKIQDGSVTIQGVPGLGDLRWESLTLDGRPNTDTNASPRPPHEESRAARNDAWRATVQASCALGCGESHTTLHAILRHSPTDTTAEATFSPPLSWSGVAPALPQGSLSATLERLSVHKDDQRTHLTLGDASANIQWGQYAGAASVETLTVDLTAAREQAPALKAHIKRLGATNDIDAPTTTPDAGPLVSPWLNATGLRATITSLPDDILVRADALRAQWAAIQGQEGDAREAKAPQKTRRRGAARTKRGDRGRDRRSALRREADTAQRPAQLAKALSKVTELRDRARPLLQHVSVKDAELRWPSQRLTLSEGAVRRAGEDIVVEAAWQGMKAGVALTPPQQPPAWTFRDLPLQRIRELVAPLDRALADVGPLKRLEGTLHGRLFLETRSGTLPWEAPSGPRTEASPSKPEKQGPLRTGVRLKGRVSAERGLLEVQGLSPGPLAASRVDVDLDATWWWPTRQGAALEVSEIGVTLPSREGAEVTLRGSSVLSRLGDRRLKPRVSLRVWVDEGDCAAIVGAIPAGMLPNIGDHLALKGRFSPTLDFFIDMKRLHSVKMQIQGLPGTCVITDLGEFDPSYLAGDFKQEVEEGVTREGIFVGPQSGSYVPLRAMPQHLQVATYVSEEWNFYKNKGFDLQRTTGAVRLNLEHGRYVYGGSTLTQQLVKNLFLSRDKTLSRKLEEAFIVWKIEEILSKDRILELYLNCIEFGPNIYGIGRAAAFYFGKSASRLSLLESVFLAGIKPRPSMGIGPYSKGRTPEDGYWPERMYRVMLRMVNAGHLPSARLEALAPYTVYFKTWRGPRPDKPGAPPPAEDAPD